MVNISENKQKNESMLNNNESINKNQITNKRKYEYESEDEFSLNEKNRLICLLTFINHYDFPPPNSYEEIVNRQDKEGWLEAIKDEKNNLIEKIVYEERDHIPPGKNLITLKWIFTYKRNNKKR